MNDLTIGQLAAYVGVTTRAVRHYHDRGLLDEPVRDASGYRRYDVQAVLKLIRIKVLADAGVPLARVEELLDADPAALADAVAEIDAIVRGQIAELEDRRRRLADLAGGDEDVFLPGDLAAFLAELRGAGVAEHIVQAEREGWILLLARYPDRALDWLARKRADLADPDFRALYRGYDHAAGWDPDDPRVEELATAIVRYLERRYADEGDAASFVIDDPTAIALQASYFSEEGSPAIERVAELVRAKAPRALAQTIHLVPPGER
jgi:DNA-binding transcriptional MerR regulator